MGVSLGRETRMRGEMGLAMRGRGDREGVVLVFGGGKIRDLKGGVLC